MIKKNINNIIGKFTLFYDLLILVLIIFYFFGKINLIINHDVVNKGKFFHKNGIQDLNKVLNLKITFVNFRFVTQGYLRKGCLL